MKRAPNGEAPGTASPAAGVVRRILRPLDHVSALVAKPLDYIAAILIAAIMIHVVIDASSRLLFHRSLEGTTEIVSYYYMVGVVFLPLLALRRSRGFITADLFTAAMSPRMEKVLDILGDLLLAAWFLFFAWVSTLTAMKATETGEFVETTTSVLTTWPSRWVLPVVGLLVGLHCLVEAAERWLDDTYQPGADADPELEVVDQ